MGALLLHCERARKLFSGHLSRRFAAIRIDLAA
jgi:hypothetical protein